MRVLLSLTLLLSIGACSGKKKTEPAKSVDTRDPAEQPARAKSIFDDVEPGQLLLRQGLKREIETNIGKGIITAFGTEYDAKAYCSAEVVANPRSVAIFRVRGSADVLAYHCPGSTTAVTLFVRKQEPRTQHLKMNDGEPTLTAAGLETIVRDLLAVGPVTYSG